MNVRYYLLWSSEQIRQPNSGEEGRRSSISQALVGVPSFLSWLLGWREGVVLLWFSAWPLGGSLSLFCALPCPVPASVLELSQEPQGPHFSNFLHEMLPRAGDGDGSHVDRSIPRTSVVCQDCREVCTSGGHLHQKCAGLPGGWECVWGTAWAWDSSRHFSHSVPALMEHPCSCWRMFQP